MTELIICGQAPSRIGDGTPFSGPSGRRLASLFDLENFEALAEQVTLTNIFNVPAAAKPLPARRSNRSAPGDEFDLEAARTVGVGLMVSWASRDHQVAVLACGGKVFTALTGHKGPMYVGRRVDMVDVWHFPHPSGASQYWNDPVNVNIASQFLKRLLDRYGIVIA